VFRPGPPKDTRQSPSQPPVIGSKKLPRVQVTDQSGKAPTTYEPSLPQPPPESAAHGAGVRKAVFPAVGARHAPFPAAGDRKHIRRRMLPLVRNKPTILTVGGTEGKALRGSTKIILGLPRNKRATRDHFRAAFELEYYLAGSGQARGAGPDQDHLGYGLPSSYRAPQKEPTRLGPRHPSARAPLVRPTSPLRVLPRDDINRLEVRAMRQLLERLSRRPLAGPGLALMRNPRRRSVRLWLSSWPPGCLGGKRCSRYWNLVEKAGFPPGCAVRPLSPCIGPALRPPGPDLFPKFSPKNHRPIPREIPAGRSLRTFAGRAAPSNAFEFRGASSRHGARSGLPQGDGRVSALVAPPKLARPLSAPNLKILDL